MTDLNLNLYSSDILIATFNNMQLSTIYKPDLLPLYFKRSKFIIPWLESRAVDSHRPSSRLLKKALRLNDASDLNTVLSQNAITLTDTYWVKSTDNTMLSYNDVKAEFNENISTLALTGSYDSFNNVANTPPFKTYELTNVGSYEKCWFYIDDDWYMLKQATKAEAFSEIFCYYLAKHFNFFIAEYSITKDGYIKSKNFAKDYNFEPMWNLVQDNDDYTFNISILKEYGEDFIKDFLKILYIDTLVGNPDRHTKNYGILRNRMNGKAICMAPNYDNNLAFISRGVPQNITRKNDILIKLFLEIFKKYPQYTEIFQSIFLNEEILTSLIKQSLVETKLILKEDEVLNIVTFVLSAYKIIKAEFKHIK